MGYWEQERKKQQQAYQPDRWGTPSAPDYQKGIDSLKKRFSEMRENASAYQSAEVSTGRPQAHNARFPGVPKADLSRRNVPDFTLKASHDRALQSKAPDQISAAITKDRTRNQTEYDNLPAWEKARIMAFGANYVPGQDSVPIERTASASPTRQPIRQLQPTQQPATQPARQQPPETVETIRGMDLTRREVGQDSPFGRVPGMEEDRTRVYDSMGRKTYDSEVWDQYVPEFMQGNLNRETDIQKANIDASSRMGVARIGAEAGIKQQEIAGQYNLKAAGARGSQGVDPYKFKMDRMNFIQKQVGDFHESGEARTAAENQAGLKFDIMQRQTSGIEKHVNPKTKEVRYTYPDGKVVDQDGQLIPELSARDQVKKNRERLASILDEKRWA